MPIDPAISAALREFYLVATIIGVVSGFVGNIIGGRVTARWLEKNQKDLWDAVGKLQSGQVDQVREFAEMKGRCDTVMKFDLHTKKKNGYQGAVTGP